MNRGDQGSCWWLRFLYQCNYTKCGGGFCGKSLRLVLYSGMRLTAGIHGLLQGKGVNLSKNNLKLYTVFILEKVYWVTSYY